MPKSRKLCVNFTSLNFAEYFGILGIFRFGNPYWCITEERLLCLQQFYFEPLRGQCWNKWQIEEINTEVLITFYAHWLKTVQWVNWSCLSVFLELIHIMKFIKIQHQRCKTNICNFPKIILSCISCSTLYFVLFLRLPFFVFFFGFEFARDTIKKVV
jgi:hypothetical protein